MKTSQIRIAGSLAVSATIAVITFATQPAEASPVASLGSLSGAVVGAVVGNAFGATSIALAGHPELSPLAGVAGGVVGERVGSKVGVYVAEHPAAVAKSVTPVAAAKSIPAALRNWVLSLNPFH